MSDPSRIDLIFNDALELPSSEREAYLDEACGSDRKLRQRVGRLLKVHGQLGSFLVPSRARDLHPDTIADTAIERTSLQEGTSLSSMQLLGDRYRIETLLGRGGMGEVWRAFDLKLRVDVALKAAREEVLATAEGREFLRREVRAARNVISPNVCRIFDLEMEHGLELVSMEYIDGRTLKSILEERAPLELREAGEIAAQLLAGLEAIHGAGLVHRDLKPENVMLTRAGRVVVMDFGLAKAVADGHGVVAGTPAYMAPEQARGDVVDARADIFSVGIILAEMLSATREPEQRQALWRQLREDPPKIPEGPWQALIRHAVAWLPGDRYPTARALSRALEEVTLRVEGMDDRTPYPGLSSFTEEDAEYFFGREAEVEVLGKKLQRLSLLAVVGPSGFGKSSFLRAGLIPALPENWDCVVCTPGSTPFNSLALALAPHLEANAEALPQLLQISQPGVAVDLTTKWRQRHEDALLVVDQFEELFTLCPPETQRAFAELLRRLVLEADIRVLLSMRDDFLFHAHELEALRPIFSELTLLESLSGSSLRRALVQPALACGYRFEDEALVDEMVDEVQEERGALPLLAFAAARMWDRRDRSTGALTRQAYEDVGGVSGALAQHAEATLTALGREREPLVRELFRNLVTSQGTRAVRETRELLSVFDEREEAAEILRKLIDARLLTSFDVPGTGSADDGPAQQVEIIHESLLKAWPRLVRWQTQDADGAVLRDQVRQAAQMWEERSRSNDLLWTGTAYREFELWRDQYSGGLTEREELFAAAMKRRMQFQTRMRRWGVTATIVVLVAVVGVVGTLWQNATHQARRAEARNVLSLAEDLIDRNTSVAFAYTLASLELADIEEARRFAVRLLQTAPISIRPPGSSTDADLPADSYVSFSPDGSHFTNGRFPSDARVWADDGRLVATLPTLDGFISDARFASDADVIVTWPWAGGNADGKYEVRVWDMPEAELIRSIVFSTRAAGYLAPDASQLLTISIGPQGPLWKRWPLPDGPPEELGVGPYGLMKLDDSHQRVIHAVQNNAFVLPVNRLAQAPGRRVGEHSRNVTAVGLDPTGQLAATAEEGGIVRVWSLDSGDLAHEFRSRGEFEVGRLEFSPDGRWLAGATPGRGDADGAAWLWDLTASPDLMPLELGIRNESGAGGVFNLDFHPTEPWMLTGSMAGPALWPLDQSHGQVLDSGTRSFSDFVISHDGNWMLGVGERDGFVPIAFFPHGAIPTVPTERFPGLGVELDPRGKYVLYGALGFAAILDLETGETRRLEGPAGLTWAVAISPSGSRYAVGGGQGRPDQRLVRLWDRETGEVTVLDVGNEFGFVSDLEFLSDHELVESREQGVWLWDLRDLSHRRLSEDAKWRVTASPDRRKLLMLSWTGETLLHGSLSLYDLETGSLAELPAFGNEVTAVVFEPGGRIVAGTKSGAVLVGHPGAEPHLLMGHRAMVRGVRMHPDGRVVAVDQEGGARVWPMPDPDEPPLHTLPYDELMAKLRGVTNLRVVEDESQDTGYRLTLDGFAGWRETPKW